MLCTITRFIIHIAGITPDMWVHAKNNQTPSSSTVSDARSPAYSSMTFRPGHGLIKPFVQQLPLFGTPATPAPSFDNWVQPPVDQDYFCNDGLFGFPVAPDQLSSTAASHAETAASAMSATSPICSGKHVCLVAHNVNK